MIEILKTDGVCQQLAWALARLLVIGFLIDGALREIRRAYPDLTGVAVATALALGLGFWTHSNLANPACPLQAALAQRMERRSVAVGERAIREFLIRYHPMMAANRERMSRRICEATKRLNELKTQRHRESQGCLTGNRPSRSC